MLFQALDKCQLGDIVRAKEQRLESSGFSFKLSVFQFDVEAMSFVSIVYKQLRCFKLINFVRLVLVEYHMKRVEHKTYILT